MGRGRPVGSPVRQNIVEILYYLGKAHGYELHKIYVEIYGKVSLRNIYYHLRKGQDIGIFKVASIEKEDGEYSWGTKAEKTYYAISEQAKPSGDERVKVFIETSDKYNPR